MSELARLNGVPERPELRGFCDPDELASALDMPGSQLLIVDVDGGEEALVDPESVPGLRSVQILLELHPHQLPGIQRTITDRFRQTHHVEHIPAISRSRRDLPEVPGLSVSEVGCVAWEARPDEQGWLWMVPRIG